jgi:hypothetical protein
MKVFISSLITGMEEYRAAAREAVETLGYEAVMAEKFAAKPQTPQVACLDGLRQSGLILLLLGADYGVKQKGGLSATHEEYRDAKGHRPVMAFVRSGVTPDPAQAALIKEVQSWETGMFRGSFSTPQDLRTQITRAIHAWQLSNATGPLDTKALSSAALAAARAEQNKHQQSDPALVLTVAAGPAQAVLRPSEIENSSLSKELLKEALFGHFPIFSHADGNEINIEGNCLIIQQGRGERLIQLDAEGNLLFRIEVERDHGSFALIKESLEQQIVNALRYAAAVLERIDPTQKLTHVALAASLAGADYITIRTQAEHNARPNSYQMSGWGRDDNSPVQLQPAHRPRAALSHEAEALAEDLVTLLRRRKNG